MPSRRRSEPSDRGTGRRQAVLLSALALPFLVGVYGSTERMVSASVKSESLEGEPLARFLARVSCPARPPMALVAS